MKKILKPTLSLHSMKCTKINRSLIHNYELIKTNNQFLNKSFFHTNLLNKNSSSENNTSVSVNSGTEAKYNIIAIDIEGTSTNHKYCKIIEVAACRVINGIGINNFSSLIYQDYIPEEVVKITNINQNMLNLAPPPKIVLSQLYHFLSSQPSTLIGHNIHYDVSVIYNEFDRHQLINNNDLRVSSDPKEDKYKRHPIFSNTICTLKLARRIFPGLKGYSLSDLVQQLNLAPSFKNAHRAAADVNMTLYLWRKIYQEVYQKLEMLPDMDFFIKLQSVPAADVQKYMTNYKLEKTFK
ncbi:hypothetical protein ABK040_001513 [Willaertia magna]